MSTISVNAKSIILVFYVSSMNFENHCFRMNKLKEYWEQKENVIQKEMKDPLCSLMRIVHYNIRNKGKAQAMDQDAGKDRTAEYRVDQFCAL